MKERRLSWKSRAEGVLRECLSSLPEDISAAMRRCPVELVGGRVDDEEKDLLGLFSGPAFAEMGSCPEIPRIRLYVDNLRDESGDDPDEFDILTRETLLHEIGHFLSLNEDDLEERGLG